MCKGLTQKGLQCRSRAHADYCRSHQDQAPIALYTPPDHWPSSRDVNRRVTKIPPLSADMIVLQFQLFYGELVVRSGSNFNNRELFVSCVELLKRNAAACLADPGVQRLVNTVAVRLEIIPELAAYVEDFKRRCLASHRAAARKRVVSFYLKRCEDLCDDVIEKVLSFV